MRTSHVNGPPLPPERDLRLRVAVRRRFDGGDGVGRPERPRLAAAARWQCANGQRRRPQRALQECQGRALSGLALRFTDSTVTR